MLGFTGAVLSIGCFCASLYFGLLPLALVFVVTEIVALDYHVKHE